jgi:hypothetical protein
MIMSETKRYDLEQGPGWDAGGARVVPSDDGDWVRSDDYDAFVVEAVNNHERLTQRMQELEKVLVLAEHKIDQYLQGQYPGGNSLGNILKVIRTALAGTKVGEKS